MKYPEFAQRFREAVRHAGASSTQKELGAFLGVSGTMAWYYLNGEKMPGMPRAIKMAARLGVNVDWLLTGRGAMVAGLAEPAPTYGANFRGVGRSNRVLLLLNYIQAGRPREVIDDYAPGAGMEEIPLSASEAEELGPYAFALEVVGDSMRDDFRPGDQLYIDPDVSPRPGEYVVAKLDRDNKATFKKFRPRGVDDDGVETFELVPLNDDYPTIVVGQKNPGHIVGTVVRHVRRFRR
jgi:SOS-response transcriptional repressor LexA